MREWESQSHVKWYCRYHVVIVPKYRHKAIFGALRHNIVSTVGLDESVIRNSICPQEDRQKREEQLNLADANGICGHSLSPPIEEAIKRLCNQLA